MTGSLARILMYVWMSEFKRLMEDNGIQLHLSKKYLDDVLVISYNLRLVPGHRTLTPL